MSCIRFNTPAQRKQMAAMAPSMLTPEEAASLHPAPPVTDSKIARLRLLAQDPNPKIRERVALDYHTPDDVMEVLATDPDLGVRSCVARNERVSCYVLENLARDSSEVVRGHVALNFYVPENAMKQLAEDPSAIVRGLVSWKTQLSRI